MVIAVAVGGFLGAPCRFLLDRYVTRRTASEMPWGTLVVNVSGSFGLGLLTGLSLAGRVPAVPEAALGLGFCGAYTTFSTFSFETIGLVESGQLAEAFANIVVSVALGLATAAAGVAVGLA